MQYFSDSYLPHKTITVFKIVKRRRSLCINIKKIIRQKIIIIIIAIKIVIIISNYIIKTMLIILKILMVIIAIVTGIMEHDMNKFTRSFLYKCWD